MTVASVAFATARAPPSRRSTVPSVITLNRPASFTPYAPLFSESAISFPEVSTFPVLSIGGFASRNGTCARSVKESAPFFDAVKRIAPTLSGYDAKYSRA